MSISLHITTPDPRGLQCKPSCDYCSRQAWHVLLFEDLLHVVRSCPTLCFPSKDTRSVNSQVETYGTGGYLKTNQSILTFKIGVVVIFLAEHNIKEYWK